jgi:hypothetical protein
MMRAMRTRSELRTSCHGSVSALSSLDVYDIVQTHFRLPRRNMRYIHKKNLQPLPMPMPIYRLYRTPTTDQPSRLFLSAGV